MGAGASASALMSAASAEDLQTWADGLPEAELKRLAGALAAVRPRGGDACADDGSLRQGVHEWEDARARGSISEVSTGRLFVGDREAARSASVRRNKYRGVKNEVSYLVANIEG
eukprot:TRINITY_DN25373_c0_g2_i3.p1 TRINITY_DN25373_c0_g2~~TRINITY_DN25373_c0_g2_i3.p1  ORF type:complete len:114 (+),score=16.28 TRINITY_DN25373_c0_g2_i3:275-616(+)